MLEYRIDKMGMHLLEVVMLNEVNPNTQYYMQFPLRQYLFKPVVFDPAVNWTTIEEFTRKKALWKIVN